MTNGVVDFNFGGFSESLDFAPPAWMAPPETFSLNGRTDENRRLVSVGDLGLKNLNTIFQDVALEEHLVASTLEDTDPWILFDSGVPIIRHGSLLFLGLTLAPFNKDEFEVVCNTFHNMSPQDTMASPTFKTLVQYHVDKWELAGNTLTRIHKRARATFFSPEGTKDRPVDLKDLSDERVTYFEYADGRKETLTDNSRYSENPKGPAPERFVGRTVFTFPPHPLAVSWLGNSLEEQNTEDTFRLHLEQTSSGTLEDFKKALLEQLLEKDPSTGRPYTHDLQSPFDMRTTGARRAQLWRALLLLAPLGLKRQTCNWFECEPEAPDYVACRCRGLKQPGEPTLTERLEPWCEVCVRAKSKQAKSRRLSLKQPVQQMDFSFFGDKPGGEQITILNVVDVLSGMALFVVIPTKAHTPYSQAELRHCG
ncbi:unnamed protein product [Symbiodinium sp. CCMP2456]|nr:unnamed protein product [Symbiodinium sp. CCMP2456]